MVALLTSLFKALVASKDWLDPAGRLPRRDKHGIETMLTDTEGGVIAEWGYIVRCLYTGGEGTPTGQERIPSKFLTRLEAPDQTRVHLRCEIHSELGSMQRSVAITHTHRSYV